MYGPISTSPISGRYTEEFSFWGVTTDTSNDS